MKMEVELKFPVADRAALEAGLATLGAAISGPHIEVDTYFSHPARDFARTDEALRLRRKKDTFFITYKGPKIDAATKTRREIELPLAVDEAGFPSWFGLLEVLGFAKVGEVRKSRRKAHVRWQNQDVEVSLDEVDGLGLFVELELVVEGNEETGEVLESRKSKNLFQNPLPSPPAPLPLAGEGSYETASKISSPSVDSAKSCILSLAERLGLSGGERRSYLELLMGK
jgi:adenylate cyclase class 2